ncbi:death regulator Nedd2-like caspase [Anticarsia gemmatalis]|uniref:death regulator Nedd2-like caspase n=1 Tax=Anticarsia gemmatalis TaxID=129554 RepID=UPI003F75A3B1
MQQEHKNAIQKNYTSLVERTDLDAMVTALYEKGVFSEQMIEPYKDTSKLPRERKRRLYSDVMRRGPLAFKRLVDTLLELGYWDIVRDLDPNSPVSLPTHSSSLPRRDPPPQSNENYVSLCEKNKTKTEQLQKSSIPAPAPTPTRATFDNGNDVVPTNPVFEVIKSKKFMEEDDNKGGKLYRTRGRKRGALVILSYKNFLNDIETERNGADVDCQMLKDLFVEFGFRVLSYNNLDYKETVETLSSMRDVLVDLESVFIVVSSHGYERLGTADTDIRCSDGQLISFTHIMTYFSNERLPHLIGIPKVFIFQHCRGSSTDHAMVPAPPAPLGRPPGDVQTDGGEPSLRPDRLYSDILIAHSTLPGLVSYRDGKLGSWYIQVLCEVFAAHAHHVHVDELLTLVDKRLHEKYRKQTSSVERWGFNKLLYLHPGLYE